MPFSVTHQQGRQILKLEGSVTIVHAQELAAKLREDLDEGGDIRVDTGALEDIDTCILQLLCSLRKSYSALTFDDPSVAVLSAVDRCGLRRELLAARESS